MGPKGIQLSHGVKVKRFKNELNSRNDKKVIQQRNINKGKNIRENECSKKKYHRKTIQRKFIENLLKVQWSSKFIKNLFVQKKIKESTYYDSTVMNRMHSRCFRKGCLTNSWRSFLYQISICFSISRFDKFTHGVLSSCRSCSLRLSSILQSCHRHRDLLFMLPSSS